MIFSSAWPRFHVSFCFRPRCRSRSQIDPSDDGLLLRLGGRELTYFDLALELAKVAGLGLELGDGLVEYGDLAHFPRLGGGLVVPGFAVDGDTSGGGLFEPTLVMGAPFGSAGGGPLARSRAQVRGRAVRGGRVSIAPGGSRWRRYGRDDQLAEQAAIELARREQQREPVDLIGRAA